MNRIYAENRGFTLAEVMVTVLVLGILASVAVPQYFKTVKTGRANKAQAQVIAVARGVYKARVDWGAAPSGGFSNADNASGCCPATGAAPSTTRELICCNYVEQFNWEEGNDGYTYRSTDSGATAVANDGSGWTYTANGATGACSATGTNVARGKCR